MPIDYRKGSACLRLEEVEQQCDVKEAVQFTKFVGGKVVFLVLDEEFVQTLGVVRVKLNAEQRPRRRDRELAAVGLNRPRQAASLPGVDGGMDSSRA
jgi:hypothetical protein